MTPIHQSHTHVAQETNVDSGADQPGIAQPYTQTEIDELMYGDDRPVAERLARLRELRLELAERESADFGNEDPAALLGEIDRAIAELDTDAQNADETDAYAALASGYVVDPADHSETLSPDDEDALQVLEEDDEDDLTVLDETEWEDGDKFDPDRGVR